MLICIFFYKHVQKSDLLNLHNSIAGEEDQQKLSSKPAGKETESDLLRRCELDLERVTESLQRSR